jgi:hypothetical protein
MTMARYWWNFLVARSRELKIPLGFLEMTLTPSYVVAGADPVTDKLTRVALNEIGNTLSQGAEHSMITMPMQPMNVFYSGIDCFGGSLVGD